MNLVKSSSNYRVSTVLYYTYLCQFKSYVWCISNIKKLGHRFTKVNRLSSESFFLYFKLSACELMYYMHTCCYTKINRESYMSAHVLLNLLNESGKRDKRRGLPSILSLFRNEFNKFNNTRARMLDSIYHMTNTLKPDFWRKKNVIILS